MKKKSVMQEDFEKFLKSLPKKRVCEHGKYFYIYND